MCTGQALWRRRPATPGAARRAGLPPCRTPVRSVLLGALLLVLAQAVAGPVLPAAAQGVASVSDSTPDPGQVITVTGHGLSPGLPVLIYLFPDAVKLAELTVGPDGGFSQDVKIPSDTKDGPKGIQINSVHADGTYASLKLNLRVDGSAASAQLSDTTLVPNQSLRISGTRFLPGSEVHLVLFPERVELGRPVVRSDGSFSADVRMPNDLLNGKHGIVAAGPTAGGGYAYLVLDASVTGGVGQVPADFVVPANDPLLTSTSSTSTIAVPRITARPNATAPIVPAGDGSGVVVLLLALCLAAIVGLAVFWLRSSAGRVWVRDRRRRWRTRHARRRYRRGRRPGET